MWIKFKLDGELEELIRRESEDECRTCSQQALYVLKNYYKDKKRQDNSNTEQGGIKQNKVNKIGIQQNELEYKKNNRNTMEQVGTISSNSVKFENNIEPSVLDEVCAF